MHCEEIRLAIRNLQNLGVSYGVIAKQLNMSLATVQSIISYQIKKTKGKTGTKPLIDKQKSVMLKRFISNE